MSVIWSRKAIQHLAHLREFIAEDSEYHADQVAERILEAIEILQLQPQLGRPGRVSGTRELVVAGTPFLVPYRFRQGRLELLGVFHGRQKWPKKF